MSEHTPYYLHLDNGDYSIKEETIGDLLSTIEFELEKGGAKQLMVTKEFQEGHPLHTTSKLISQNKRLREAAKEWIQWFDYCHAYQQENLGKGLEQAEENWGNMFTPDPSPSIDKLRQALNESE